MRAAMSMDETTAANIVQLLNQLEGQGYAPPDLRQVRAAYDLAIALYTCQYRSSGRGLIDHAVHTASILAALGSEPALIAAMVAHAVYLHGDFGTRLRRITASKRVRVRANLGSAAEELTYRYAGLDWRRSTIAALRDEIPTLTVERQLLLMRLADQLDIYATRDVLYCDNLAQRVAWARDVGPLIVALADEVDRPHLADALRRAYSDCIASATGADPLAPAWRDGVRTPSSYRIRPSIALYQRLRGQVWAWLGR